jgi:hypothetical protein
LKIERFESKQRSLRDSKNCKGKANEDTGHNQPGGDGCLGNQSARID